MNKISLNDIFSIFGYNSPAESKVLNRKEVENLFDTEDLECLGAVFAFLSKKETIERISPPISRDFYVENAFNYYGRCIVENPQGEWADSNYSAAYAASGLFRQLWSESEALKEKPELFKIWIQELYRVGDEKVRKCIVNGILEHLFEDSKIKAFFEDWKNDEILISAYLDAALWCPKQSN